jgi:ribosomal protein S18 acetylase RimI-like enzyme
MAEVEHVPYSVASGPAGDDQPVRVRALRRDEYELLRTIRVQMLEDAPDAFTITADSERGRPLSWWRERLAATCADPKRVALVAEIGEDAIGSALGVIDTWDRSLAHLYALWVDPRARRRGVANAIVGRVFEWARERGAATVELSVTVGNVAATKLYEGVGFYDTGDREPLRPGSPLQLMKMRAPL